MGNSDSKLSPYQLSDEELQAIPTIIRMTYQSSWRKYACCFTSRNISLGPPDAEPMYTLSFPKGLYGDIIIHKGPNADSTPIATSSRIKKYHDDYLITLPSPTGNGVHEEILRRPQGLKGRFWFGCLVGNGPEQHVERFEWRRSRGAEVKSVGQSRWGGYKLVRLGSTDTKEDYSSSEDDLSDEKSNSGEGYTSDGKEIVAVWGNASCWKTMSGVGELQFRGSGATGELGNMWALMTVMSCMSIWQKVQRDNATAGASASSSSASSAAVAAAVS